MRGTDVSFLHTISDPSHPHRTVYAASCSFKRYAPPVSRHFRPPPPSPPPYACTTVRVPLKCSAASLPNWTEVECFALHPFPRRTPHESARPPIRTQTYTHHSRQALTTDPSPLHRNTHALPCGRK